MKNLVLISIFWILFSGLAYSSSTSETLVQSSEYFHVKWASPDDVRILEKLSSNELATTFYDEIFANKSPWLCHEKKLVNIHYFAAQSLSQRDQNSFQACHSIAKHILDEAIIDQSSAKLSDVIYRCPHSPAAHIASFKLVNYYFGRGEFALALLYAQIFPNRHQEQIKQIMSAIQKYFPESLHREEAFIYENYYNKLLDYENASAEFNKVILALRHHDSAKTKRFFGGGSGLEEVSECSLLDFFILYESDRADYQRQVFQMLAYSAQNYALAAKKLVSHAFVVKSNEDFSLILNMIAKIGANISHANSVLAEHLNEDISTVELIRIILICIEMQSYAKDFSNDLLDYVDKLIESKESNYPLFTQKHYKIELVASALSVVLKDSLSVGVEVTQKYLKQLDFEDSFATNSNDTTHKQLKKILTLLSVFKHHAHAAKPLLYKLLNYTNPNIQIAVLEVLGDIDLVPTAEQIARVSQYLEFDLYPEKTVYAVRTLLVWREKSVEYFPKIVELMFIDNDYYRRIFRAYIISSGTLLLPQIIQARQNIARYDNIKKFLTQFGMQLQSPDFEKYLVGDLSKDQNFAFDVLYLTSQRLVAKLKSNRNDPKKDVFKMIRDVISFCEFTKKHYQNRITKISHRPTLLNYQTRINTILEDIDWAKELELMKRAELEFDTANR